MQLKRTLEQHIAVFGESGSGKTVMVSSFYGATQEPQYRRESLFHVVADETSQGNHLHRNYLGMRNSAQLPTQTRFAATSYSFSVKLKDAANAKAARARPFDALRLVWHDYPGEWFEEDPSAPGEPQRRVDTFKSLLGSDVALLLVDGKRLLDNSGMEERYLKSLLANFRNGLLSLKDELLEDGKPLIEFPRIWVIALSKSDLLPELDVYGFRDLLIEKASDDINELREVLAGLVEGNDALSVGEDFVLLSSAKFGADKIEVTKRVGLGLVLPMASMLPFERHIRWARRKDIPRKVAQNLVDSTEILAKLMIAARQFLPARIGMILSLIGPDVVNEAVKQAGDQLREINSEAIARKDYLTATLTRFRMDLEQGEEDRILIRSLK